MCKSACLLITGIVMSLTACTREKNDDGLNTRASLPASFNFSQLGLKVVNSSLNRRRRTMSTLYGNNVALKNAIAGNKNPQQGEVLALVTWKKQADDHWFGANIPGDLQSVEMVKTLAVNQQIVVKYQRFEGKQLTANTDTLHQQDRIKYIIGQRPSAMP